MNNSFTIGDRVQVLVGYFKDQWGKVVDVSFGMSVEIEGQTYRYLPHEIQTVWYILDHSAESVHISSRYSNDWVITGLGTGQMVLDLLNRFPT